MLKIPSLAFCLANDSNNLVVGLENGFIQTGVVVLYSAYKYKNYVLTMLNESNIAVSDIHSEYNAKLDFGSAAITFITANQNMVLVVAGCKCHLYDTKNFITPIIFELPDELLLFSGITATYIYFALSSAQTKLLIYDFHGKQVSNLKLNCQSINQRLFAASLESIACVDSANAKSIQFLDTYSGKETTVFKHSNEVFKILFNSAKDPKNRKLAFLDSNKDLYIYFIARNTCRKIISMAVSFLWNENYDALAYTTTNKVSILYAPSALCYDAKLVASSTIIENVLNKCELTEFNDCQLCSTTDRNVSLIHQVNNFAFKLIKTITNGQAGETTTQLCIKLARFFKSNLVWSVLAVYSLENKDTDTSELCLAALQEIDKVQVLSRINAIEDKDLAQFEFMKFLNKLDDCEKYYLSQKRFLDVVKLYTIVFNFKKAFEMAKQIKTLAPQFDWLADYVLHKRRKYIASAGFAEDTNEFFASLTPKCSVEEIKQKKILSEKVKI